MLPPDLLAYFAAAFLGLVSGVLGGMGGRWWVMRELRQRQDELSVDLDGLRTLLRKGTGRAAVEVRERNRAAEDDITAELRERAAAEKGRTHPGPPSARPRAARLLPDGEPDPAAVARAFGDSKQLVQVNE